MSTSSWITFRFNSAHPNAARVFGSLRAAQWSEQQSGLVTFLPLGDKGDFDWTSAGMSGQEFLDLVERKQAEGEAVGVLLTWEESDTGGEFVLSPDGVLHVALSRNRKVEGSAPVTDVAWYLRRILPSLEAVEVVRAIEWSEVR